ncbi:UDP-galactose 4-epimerase [Magnetococcus marinus MC-1]|uniref:UDP-glucose 4-epimerase n=1 Tax=Magnetococcus marinus (strain ATCC BAA-1437 / JCM 17883 / MC-1) TaxID=156889 RepID=A0L5P6_MAGMM|nr:UDP-glucose 4-epimerase GalE [Magnetococcus marinus]ABK43289.1 UDP-galactose 4-epimerase [Magnetococcus marinus MC-1]
MKAILVTGGAGYIGSHVCKVLSQSGFLPITYDNLSEGHPWAVRWGPLVVGGLDDGAKLAGLFAQYQPQAVIHLAGRAYVGESMTDPALYYRNNVQAALVLLECMRQYGCKNIIFSSSCATYGEHRQMPITEAMSQHPINPYGRSKLMFEWMLQDYQVYGLQSVALRYFNASGADLEGEIGEQHQPEPHIIPRLLEAARKGSPFTIYGTDYESEDGTCVRDYIHVSDLAQAHLLALQWLWRGGESRAFNLGNGQGFSIRQLIKVAETVTGKSIAVQLGARRPGDPAVLVGSAEKAREELGWQPQYGTLEIILTSAWRWMQRRQDPPVVDGIEESIGEP